jgi:exodeoxyribonuclease VII small subunit
MAQTGFEQKLAKLEKIVEQMEKSDTGLDQSLKAFEEGVQLVRECRAHLGETEAKIKTLLSVSADGSAETKDFEFAKGE